MERILSYIRKHKINTVLIAAFSICVIGFSCFGYFLSGLIVGLLSVALSYSVINLMESYVKRIEDITEEQTELLMDSLEMDLESFEKELLGLDNEEPYQPPHQR